MKKTKKALASLAIAGMTLSMLPFNAFAASTVPTRLAGGTAAQTAVAIAEQTGWTGTAILASSASYGMVDALTSGPLATFLKAPILLQEPGAVLNADTKAELTKLNVKKVYVTSGTSVISQAVLDQMTGMGITVESLGGADRFETSVNIAKKMVALGAPVSKVAVAYGWLNQDALSIASIASASSSPILLTEKNALPASVQAFLSANASVTASDVIGGTGVISDAVKAALPNATRHAGNTAYDTNNQVIQDFDSALTYGNVFVASGVTGIDALAGAPLAAASKSAIVLTDGTTSAAASFVHGKLAADSVVTALGGTAVVPETVRTEVVNGPTQQGNLSVTSVSAAAADSFKVVFNQAPVDTSKVTFTVQNGTMPVTVSATWNTANTEATLTSSSKFVQGDYTVAVKNDTTDLGTSNVSVTEQKVAKIEITANKLGVTSVTKNNATTQTGYATYKIYDQYGVDITSTAMAQDVQFQTGVGTCSWDKGLLKISPSTSLNLLTFSGGVVVTANDSSTGVSTTATLQATSQIGTLSDFKFGDLKNVDGKSLTAGDTTDVFYADYTATDLSGNATNNFTMLQQGLILSTDGNNSLTTSNPNQVTAQLIQDPADSTKGLIKVVSTDKTVQVDMPLVITAMTWTGKTSQINTTLKKQAQVNSFTLYSPTESVASGESKIIPFTALDQNGNPVTKLSDLKGHVTLTGADWAPTLDGTAAIKNTAVTNTGTSSIPDVISAVTDTGKYSSITINIQKPVQADQLTLDPTVLMGNLQQGGAAETADFGFDNGGFSVKDQYGRVIDMTTAKASNYFVKVTSSDPTVIKAWADSPAGTLTTGQTRVHIQSAGVGSANVKFELFDTTVSTTTAVDTKSQTFYSVKNDDIKDYTIDQLTKPIYVVNNTSYDADKTAALSDQNLGFKANPKVYGTLSAGGKVILNGNPVLGVNPTSGDFAVNPGYGAYDSIKVVANALADPAKTSASAYIIVTLKGVDGQVYTVKTPITSSTDKPAVSDLGISVETDVTGITKDNDANIVTITPPAGKSYQDLLGSTLAKYNVNGTSGSTQNVYFNPTDQYGSHAAWLAQFFVTDSHFTNANAVTVDSYGTLHYNGTIVAGDSMTVSASTTTGLVQSLKIVFGSGSSAVDTTAPTVTGVTDGSTYSVAVTPVSADADVASTTLTKDGVAVAGYALGTAIPDNGAYVLTVKDNAGNATVVNFTIDSSAKVLTGTFGSLFGVSYCKVTLPDASQAVTKVTVDGVTKTAGTDYGSDAGVVTIQSVTATNAITITTANGIVYTVQ